MQGLLTKRSTSSHAPWPASAKTHTTGCSAWPCETTTPPSEWPNSATTGSSSSRQTRSRTWSVSTHSSGSADRMSSRTGLANAPGLPLATHGAPEHPGKQFCFARLDYLALESRYSMPASGAGRAGSNPAGGARGTGIDNTPVELRKRDTGTVPVVTGRLHSLPGRVTRCSRVRRDARHAAVRSEEMAQARQALLAPVLASSRYPGCNSRSGSVTRRFGGAR